MNTLTKTAAGLALALTATFALAAPASASTCGCGGGDDWDSVGYAQWLDGGDTMRFDLYMGPGETVDLWFESERVRHHLVDLDMWIIYPDGRQFGSDDVGDDDMTITTRGGGMFQVYISNIDNYGTDFTLYVDE